ncbi:AraC family transcriptional regulator (plasmid) [Mycobacterium sp. TJFP1]
MTSFAHPANTLTKVANRRGHVIWRQRGPAVLAGSYRYNGTGLVTGWHWHDLHQIQYAIGGVIEVQTAEASYLLPPQQAAWIPAGLEHQVTMGSNVRTVAVMFDPSLMRHCGDRARILAVSPLIREMVIYALRWPIERLDSDPVSATFFQALADLFSEALDDTRPLSLPTSDDPMIAAAMEYTKDHLPSVTAEEVSRAVAVSHRTLRRQFAAQTGMTWQRYLLQARMLHAMVLLAGDSSVQQTSTAVGFDNVSSFTRAFTQFNGETPSAYRRKVIDGDAHVDSTAAHGGLHGA